MEQATEVGSAEKLMSHLLEKTIAGEITAAIVVVTMQDGTV